MLNELEQIGNGDPMPLIGALSGTASALMQLMPKQDELQQMRAVLNPPDILALERQQAQTQAQDNYVNPDLAPRPGK